MKTMKTLVDSHDALDLRIDGLTSAMLDCSDFDRLRQFKAFIAKLTIERDALFSQIYAMRSA